MESLKCLSIDKTGADSWIESWVQEGSRQMGEVPCKMNIWVMIELETTMFVDMSYRTI
jgi:hypothetical protein